MAFGLASQAQAKNRQNQGIDDCNSFLFSLKISITALLFYWRNDTPSFVTWRSRLATAPDTPMCIVIHGGQFTGRVHPLNQFVPEIVSPLPCSPALHYRLYIFSKNLFLSSVPLTNATPAFSTL